MTVILVIMINRGGRLAIGSPATLCGPPGVVRAGEVTSQGGTPHAPTQRTAEASTAAPRRADSAGGGALPGAVTSSVPAAHA